MKKGDKYSLGYAIGNSIQENKDKIAKLEKKVENLKNKNKKLQCKLEEKDKIINEILDLFGTDDCPNSIDWIDEKYSKQIKKICDCDNCRDDYKKCWIKYFKNEILERGKNANTTN